MRTPLEKDSTVRHVRTTIETCLLPAVSMVYRHAALVIQGLMNKCFSLYHLHLHRLMGTTITWVSFAWHLCNPSFQNLCLKWTTWTLFFILMISSIVSSPAVFSSLQPFLSKSRFEMIHTWFFISTTIVPLLVVLSSLHDSSVTTCRDDSNCARQTVTHGVEILSISLSLMTLITRAKVHIPITSGTLLPNADSSGTTRNTTSSSYPAHFFDLQPRNNKFQGTCASATKSNQMQGIVYQSIQW